MHNNSQNTINAILSEAKFLFPDADIWYQISICRDSISFYFNGTHWFDWDEKERANGILPIITSPPNFRRAAILHTKQKLSKTSE